MNKKFLIAGIVLFASLTLSACSSKIAQNTPNGETNISESPATSSLEQTQTSNSSPENLSPSPTQTDEQLLNELNQTQNTNLDSQFKQLESELN